MEHEYGIQPNGVVYSTAIASCSRAKPKPDVQQALLLLDEVVAKKKIYMNVVGYNAVLSTLAKVGDYKKAIDILQKMENGYYSVHPDTVTYSTVMTACERAERWEDVLHYGNKIKNNDNLKLDGIAITTILHACQALGYADLALDYLQLMKDNTSSYNRYSKTNGKLRQGVKAPLLHPDHVAYCLTISACSKAGRIRDSIRLFQELNAINQASVKAYTAVIDGCSTIGNHQLALHLLNNMYSKFSLKPTVVTYSSVLTACASALAKYDNKDQQEEHMDIIERENIIETAYNLFHNMCMSNDTSIHPNIITYNAMLQVYAEGCKLHQCFGLFQQLTKEGKKPTIVTFGTLMSACERVENVTAMNDVFDYMKVYGIEPNEIVYGAAISCSRKAKQSDKALELLNAMISSKLYPNIVTFNTVFLSLLESNNKKQSQKQPKGYLLNKALELYKTYLVQDKNDKSKSKLKPNIQTYQMLIYALSNAQRPKEAESILRDMIATFTEKPDVILYTSIITAYEKINQPKNSLRLLEEMREIGYDFYDSKLLNELFKRMVRLVHWGASGF